MQPQNRRVGLAFFVTHRLHKKRFHFGAIAAFESSLFNRCTGDACQRFAAHLGQASQRAIKGIQFAR